MFQVIIIPYNLAYTRARTRAMLHSRHGRLEDSRIKEVYIGSRGLGPTKIAYLSPQATENVSLLV